MDKNMKTWRVHFPNGEYRDIQAWRAYIEVNTRVLKFVIGKDPYVFIAEFNLDNIVGYEHIEGEFIYGG